MPTLLMHMCPGTLTGAQAAATRLEHRADGDPSERTRVGVHCRDAKLRKCARDEAVLAASVDGR